MEWPQRSGIKGPRRNRLHKTGALSWRSTHSALLTGKQPLNLLASSPTDGKTAFCVFLKSEFSEENIEFWTACEEFRMHTSQENLLSRASSIYEEFVKNEAPKEVTEATLPVDSGGARLCPC